MNMTKEQTGPPLLRGTDLAMWTGGQWEGTIPDVLGVTQDGKRMLPGGLYVALKGERYDGHTFVEQAQQNGAAAALVRSDWSRPPGVTIPLLRVAETRSALGMAAAGRRRTLKTFILGITGSAGKTTTKELAAAVFSGGGCVHATFGNLNNDVGLPLTLLAIPETAATGVVEIGTSHPGEIGNLCRVLNPDAAIVTVVGPAHIEHFTSEKAIAAEKAELIRSVPERGFAVLNAAGVYASYLREQAACRIVTVCLGEGPESDFVGKPIDLDDGFIMVCEQQSGESQAFRSGLSGRHNALNLLLAVAAARTAGLAWEAIAQGLAHLNMPQMRWQRTEAAGVVSINDAYNANPLSMRCALDAFSQTKALTRRVVVLGDMLELGVDSERFHRELGCELAEGPWQMVVAVGKNARWIAEAAINAGFPATAVHYFSDTTAAVNGIAGLVKPGDTLLFKASRGMALEQVEAAVLGRA